VVSGGVPPAGGAGRGGLGFLSAALTLAADAISVAKTIARIATFFIYFPFQVKAEMLSLRRRTIRIKIH
jgi:hypothetical protein